MPAVGPADHRAPQPLLAAFDPLVEAAAAQLRIDEKVSCVAHGTGRDTSLLQYDRCVVRVTVP